MSVNIKLSGDGLSFEAEATVLQAARIIGFLGNDASVAPLGNVTSVSYEPAHTALSLQEKPISPRERLLQVGAKTNSQKILTLGQFVMDRDHASNFSVADVKSMFGRAGEPVPRNLGRDIKDAVRLGYIYDDETVSDHYIVTGKGQEMLTGGFSAEMMKSSRPKVPRKRTPKQATSVVNDMVKSMEVSDIMEGFSNYRTLAQKSDRLMWILAYAHTHGIERMSAKDIEDVAQRLSDNIPARQVAPFTQTALKKGYLSKTSEGYGILFSGIHYLEAKGRQGDEESGL